MILSLILFLILSLLFSALPPCSLCLRGEDHAL